MDAPRRANPTRLAKSKPLYHVTEPTAERIDLRRRAVSKTNVNRHRIVDTAQIDGEGSPNSERFLSARDIVDYYQGKISLRLAYQIMDECEPVRAGKKRLITSGSFEKYLRAGQEKTKPAQDDVPKIISPDSPPISRKGGRSQPDVEFEFFRFQH
jgi:hypothetical protein